MRTEFVTSLYLPTVLIGVTGVKAALKSFIQAVISVAFHECQGGRLEGPLSQ